MEPRDGEAVHVVLSFQGTGYKRLLLGTLYRFVGSFSGDGDVIWQVQVEEPDPTTLRGQLSSSQGVVLSPIQEEKAAAKRERVAAGHLLGGALDQAVDDGAVDEMRSASDLWLRLYAMSRRWVRGVE